MVGMTVETMVETTADTKVAMKAAMMAETKVDPRAGTKAAWRVAYLAEMLAEQSDMRLVDLSVEHWVARMVYNLVALMVDWWAADWAAMMAE